MVFSDLKAKGGNHLHKLKSIYCCCTCTSPRENVLQQVKWTSIIKHGTTVQLYPHIKETKHTTNQASDLKNPTVR